ncbi:MAG: outer membrane protein assembly factor BamA [Desulfobacterales bacterium]|nr:MAG: outer membrane protein assembly factor BamA [Desulfobacterales bacterium]
MIKRLCLVFIALVGYVADAGYAQQTVSIVVMPFEVHAKEQFLYLQSEIPEAIAKNLEQEGARVLVLDRDSVPAWQERVESIEQIRKLGLQTGAEYILWGSLTWIGQQFSLDLKLLSSLEDQKANLFSEAGKGIENIPASVKEIVKDISFVIFKREIIVEVLIKGNDRIEEDAINRVIKTKPGDIYNLKSLSQDLKAIHSMGYFDDIRIEAEIKPQGKTIIFKVKEKPTLRSIRISGNIKAYDDEEIKEVLTIKSGSILNIFKIKNDVNRIGELYKEKNYHNVKVDYKIYPRKKNQADLEFIIEEGKKVRISEIQFEGNRAYSSRKLKGVMTTSEKSILSWITSAGDLVQQNLEQDVAKIRSFYHNHGYIQARVGEPQIVYKGNNIEITIKIDEGPQFKVGKVDLAGDLILPQQKLLEKIKITDEKFYNRETLRNDILALSDLYANEGYANVDVSPRIDQDKENLIVNITYEINKGKQVYFEEIIISGNSKTRDKVIRRELRVYEQELFSAQRLKRSVRNLYRLDFFEDIKVDTAAGSSDDKKILKIDITEKSTGAVQFGAGFGNVESFFGVASISERNLFGRGQRLGLEGKFGAKTFKYTLSFTEPWLFNIPLSATIEAYNWNYDYDTYNKDSLGGKLRFSYPIFDYTRGDVSYLFDYARISNVDEYAANSIKDLKGTNVKSSIKAGLGYDSRDSAFHPTHGSDHGVSVEYAGLGGDIGFIKYLAETAWYYNLFWDAVVVGHSEGGYVDGSPNMKLPDYEKFYLGGINSLRGFERGDLSPRDETGNEVGGNKFIQFNFEFRYPLLKDLGVLGVAFFDTGQVWGDDESVDFTDLRESAGLGIKWLSPMGPISLFYGWILDREDSDHGTGGFEFSMATAF